MYDHYLTALKTRLLNRANFVTTARMAFFSQAVVQFRTFLNNEPALKASIDSLKAQYPSIQQDAGNFYNRPDQSLLKAEFAEHACFCYDLLTTITTNQKPIFGPLVSPFQPGKTNEENLELFKAMFIFPIVDYLKESLESGMITAHVLNRYKQRCEWFERENLNKIATEDSKAAERRLGLNFTNFLFDSGKEFVIEPESADGWLDVLVSKEFVADAKVFRDDISKIKAAIQQVYKYATNHGQTTAYIVVYEVGDRHLNINFAKNEDGIPFLLYSGRTIFILTIDVLLPRPTASKAGKPKAATLEEKDVIDELNKPVL